MKIELVAGRVHGLLLIAGCESPAGTQRTYYWLRKQATFLDPSYRVTNPPYRVKIVATAVLCDDMNRCRYN
jgi:hypothetical protein